jgi:DNA helicase II / ATP-dependent DNA helicase PcrA
VLDLNTLNAAQYEAVTTTEGPLLVLAGAGSGKTRVLTYRIAHILEEGLAESHQILAITFTNKAAGEMRERLRALLGDNARGMWVSTFHALCVRLLRADASRLGYTRDFTIYDDDDQKRLMKEIYATLDINPKTLPLPLVRGRISAAKSGLLTVEEYSDTHKGSPIDKKVAEIYRHYEDRLRRADAMDFDDLLLLGYRLLKENPDIRAGYQQRFRYILIDEYQDTNRAQYEIARMLAEGYRNIMVVGDDDQSIYSWRGADIGIILNFEKEYEEARVVKLEQNYRSTQTILNAANEVIAHNTNRKKKRLFTEDEAGEKIEYYCANDERDEGRWIASIIEKQKDQGRCLDDIAIFYRTNAQSRALEDMFLRAGIAYRMVGGTRFFDRAEIRDVMAYLKLVVNPADDIAAKRIINTPRRAIGASTVEHVEGIARIEQLTFMEALKIAYAGEELQMRTRKSLAAFDELIQTARSYQGDLRAVVEHIVDTCGLIKMFEAEDSDEARSRIENIKEFFGVVQEFSESHAQDGEELISDDQPEPSESNSLGALMEWLALRSDLDSLGDSDEAVTMMTVHAAKGLEFPVVFIAGMEEGLFPHMNSMNTPSDLEEERRLAYVAITRARELLHITAAQHRSLFGMTQANPRSRFIGEIPEECLAVSGVGSRGYTGTGWEKRGDRQGIYGSGTAYEQSASRMRGRSSGSVRSSFENGSDRHLSGGYTDKGSRAPKEIFAVGDTIDHKIFGRGIVVSVEGDALSVRFKKTGDTRKLLIGFAPIVKIV